MADDITLKSKMDYQTRTYHIEMSVLNLLSRRKSEIDGYVSQVLAEAIKKAVYDRLPEIDKIVGDIIFSSKTREEVVDIIHKEVNRQAVMYTTEMFNKGEKK